MRQQAAVAAHSLPLTVARACAPAGSGMCRSRDCQPGNASIERWKFIRGQRAMRQRGREGERGGKVNDNVVALPLLSLPVAWLAWLHCLLSNVGRQTARLLLRGKLYVQTLGRRVRKGIGKKEIAQQARLVLSITSHLFLSPGHLPFVTTSIPVTKTRSRSPTMPTNTSRLQTTLVIMFVILVDLFTAVAAEAGRIIRDALLQ
jgi:hypothetical protein